MMGIFDHIKRWNKWRVHSVSNPIHKFLVLIGLRREITFDLVPTDIEEEKIQETINRLEKR